MLRAYRWRSESIIHGNRQITAYFESFSPGHSFRDTWSSMASYTNVQPPLSTYPKKASRKNADSTHADVLERMEVREISEGWPCYRHVAEWNKYCSMVPVSYRFLDFLA